MFSMFAERYPGGGGFGAAARHGGLRVGAARHAVDGDALADRRRSGSGVQTFDGSTLSSLVATLNASLRETVDAAAATLRAPSAAEAAAVAEQQEVAAAEAHVEQLEEALGGGRRGSRGRRRRHGDPRRACGRQGRLAAAKSREPPAKLRGATPPVFVRRSRRTSCSPSGWRSTAAAHRGARDRGGDLAAPRRRVRRRHEGERLPEPFITAMQAAAAALLRASETFVLSEVRARL